MISRILEFGRAKNMGESASSYERRGLDMSDWRGVLGFWRRMTSRLSGGLPAAAAAPAPAAGTSTRGSSTEDSRSY